MQWQPPSIRNDIYDIVVETDILIEIKVSIEHLRRAYHAGNGSLLL